MASAGRFSHRREDRRQDNRAEQCVITSSGGVKKLPIHPLLLVELHLPRMGSRLGSTQKKTPLPKQGRLPQETGLGSRNAVHDTRLAETPAILRAI